MTDHNYKGPVVYVVEHLDTTHGDWEYNDDGYSQAGTTGYTIEVHADKQQAEARCIELSRQDCNCAEGKYDGPFQYTSDEDWLWDDRIHLPPAQFMDWLNDVGIEVPAWLSHLVTEFVPANNDLDLLISGVEIIEWWDESFNTWNELQQRKMVEVCYCLLYVAVAYPWTGPDLKESEKEMKDELA